MLTENEIVRLEASACKGGCKPKTHREELIKAVEAYGGFELTVPKTELDSWQEEARVVGQAVKQKLSFFWYDLHSNKIGVGVTVNKNRDYYTGAVCPTELLYHSL